jgi:hypothetical protein
MFILSFSLPTIAQALVLKGRVTDPQGNNLPGASVQLVDHDRVLGRSTSGSDGLFQMSVSDTGQFVVKVEMAGFRPVEQPVERCLERKRGNHGKNGPPLDSRREHFSHRRRE